EYRLVACVFGTPIFLTLCWPMTAGGPHCITQQMLAERRYLADEIPGRASAHRGPALPPDGPGRRRGLGRWHGGLWIAARVREPGAPCAADAVQRGLVRARRQRPAR